MFLYTYAVASFLNADSSKNEMIFKVNICAS